MRFRQRLCQKTIAPALNQCVPSSRVYSPQLLSPSRTPSPSLSSLRGSTTTSSSSDSIQTSTPKAGQAPPNNAPPSSAHHQPPQRTSSTTSLGLADVLSDHPNSSAISRTLLSRRSSVSNDGKPDAHDSVSAFGAFSPSPHSPSSPGLRLGGSNLVNIKTLLSQSVNSLSPSSSAAAGLKPRLPMSYGNLPGSKSLEEVSDLAGEAPRRKERPAGAVTTSSTTANGAEGGQSSRLFGPDMTGQGFLQQLKDKGYSLYGLWSGTNSSPPPPSSSSSSAPPSSQTGHGSLQSTASALASVPPCPSSSMPARFADAHARTATGLNTSRSSGVDRDSEEVSPSNILPPESESGVLGALTNFRRGGLL